VNLAAIRSAVFREEYPEKTTAILTQWSDRRKTPEQLQWAANTAPALAEYLQEDFGRWRTLIRRRFHFKVADLGAAGGTLSFPGGVLTYGFTSDSRDRGSIQRTLAVEAGWFTDGPRLAALLEILGFRTQAFELELNVELDPLSKIERLEVAGWAIEQEAEAEIRATKGDLRMTVRTAAIQFSGVDLAALLAGEAGEFTLAIDAV